MAHDSRKILGKTRPTHSQSGRPSFRGLIAAKAASFSEPFPPHRRAARNVQKMRQALPRLGAGNHEPLIPNGRSMISGGSWGNRDQSATNLGDALSAAQSRLMMPHFRSHFHPSPDRSKWRENEACLSAIRFRKEGTVNSQRLVHDFRTIMGKSRPLRRESERPFPTHNRG